MSRIVTNTKVGVTMSDLEVRARKGCPFAQEEIERQAFMSANVTKTLQRQGISREDIHKEFKKR